MKTLVTAIVTFLALTALTANASTITDPGQGALQMTLIWDTNGDAYLMKNTIYNSGTASVDGYEIRSSAEDLSPTGWRSIADWVSIDPATLMASLGVGALTYGELTATTVTLAEATLSSTAVFQPDVMFQIGTPLAAPPNVGALTFYYGLSTDTTTDKYLGLITQIPEPATMGLLLIGLPWVMRRRRS